MNIIKAVNLVFDYIRRDEEGQVEEVKRALDHVNLEIEKGSFVAILGHNGSGKSTFAKQINGILSPTDGTLFVSEMDTRDEAHLWDIRKNAGMVFQYSGRGRRIRSGKYRSSDRGDLEASG